jgi:hypothetical protein
MVEIILCEDQRKGRGYVSFDLAIRSIGRSHSRQIAPVATPHLLASVPSTKDHPAEAMPGQWAERQYCPYLCLVGVSSTSRGVEFRTYGGQVQPRWLLL